MKEIALAMQNGLRTGPRALLRLTLGLALVLTTAGCGPLGHGGAGSPDLPDVGAGPRAGDDRVALVLDGRKVTIGELHAHMQQQFLDELLRQPEAELFEMREQAARDLVQRHVVEAAAAEKKTTPEALFEEVTGAAPKATPEDVQAWFTANESRLRGAKLGDVAGRIEQLLNEEARQKAWSAFLEPRLAALDWRMEMEPPRVDLAATRLIRGPKEAPVTITTFSDYQCPYCIRSEPVLAEVLSRYPGRVRVIHRHFPLDSIHPFARPASEAAMCADEQGEFWAYHDAIFAKSGRLTDASFTEIGQQLGLDVEALGECIEERRYRDFVQSDFTAGQAAGVTGTPAFFVNGIPLKGARTADQLSEVIDAELARLTDG